MNPAQGLWLRYSYNSSSSKDILELGIHETLGWEASFIKFPSNLK